MSDLEQDETKPRRYVGTIGHVGSRKSLMTAAIMKLLAEAGTEQEVQAMVEKQTAPTAWKSMDSAPKDDREILVRNSFGYWAVRWRPNRNEWGNDFATWHECAFDAWTDIPS